MQVGTGESGRDGWRCPGVWHGTRPPGPGLSQEEAWSKRGAGLLTHDTLTLQVMQLCRGAGLCIAGCLVPSAPPTHDNEKCPQTLPKSPWGAKSPQLRTAGIGPELSEEAMVPGAQGGSASQMPTAEPQMSPSPPRPSEWPWSTEQQLPPRFQH